MSSPLETPEFGNLYVGNPQDDDGTVLSKFLIETDTPPQGITEAIHPFPLERPKRPTRVFGGSFTFVAAQLSAYSPIMILPFDPNRQDLTIKAYCAVNTAADYVFVSDENGKMNANSAGKLRASSADFDMSSHIGPVWIFPSATLTGDFEVNWWATTL